MEEYKLKNNNKQLFKYIKLILITFLLVIEIVICAQYVTQVYLAPGPEKFALLRLILVFSCCLALAIFEIIDSLVIKTFTVKMIFYGIDSALLLVLCMLTGNSYLSIIYCLVLTQFYISVDDIKKNMILFGVSCGLFIVTIICGGLALNREALYIAQIVGDCVLGVFILGVHCIITNFVLRFYSKNVQLAHALKEADESKAQLKEVYEQLSNTAVYEERNRIAKDIHDNAGHSMTTVIMQTEAAKLLIDTDPEEAKNRIISANMQAKNALEQMRESVHLLAGRAQTGTLREEIEEIIAQTMDGTELKIRCDLEELSVGSEENRFILNCVKECIANGLRHGKATAFYVELKKSLSNASLLISDNGCGIKGDVEEGFGLRSMREKAEALGGRCDFSSEEGEGFETLITLPLPDKSKEEK